MFDMPKSESNFDDVGRFHGKFNLPSVTEDGAYPRHPEPKLMEFRANFLYEELDEFLGAIGLKLIDQVIIPDPDFDGVPNHAEAFDALLDLVYVAMGTAHLLGYPWQAGWYLVQQANMEKVRAQSDGSDSKRGSSFDVVKPEGWQPPNIAKLLEGYGWGEEVL